MLSMEYNINKLAVKSLVLTVMHKFSWMWDSQVRSEYVHKTIYVLTVALNTHKATS